MTKTDSIKEQVGLYKLGIAGTVAAIFGLIAYEIQNLANNNIIPLSGVYWGILFASIIFAILGRQLFNKSKKLIEELSKLSEPLNVNLNVKLSEDLILKRDENFKIIIEKDDTGNIIIKKA